MLDSEMDSVVYEGSETFYPCCVRVIRNPYDPDDPIFDWYLESHPHDCPYPCEDVLEFHKGVSVTVVRDTATGELCTMWRKGSKDAEDSTTVSTDIRIYDTETVYEHQIVDVWYPNSGDGDCHLDWYNFGEERVAVFPGYYKGETIRGATVVVWSNSITGQSSAAWTRE